MDTNKNSYTFIYASVLVIIVAFLLALVSSVLKPTQQRNIELDKKKQVLAALNILDVKDAEAAYAEYVQADQIINTNGDVVAETGGFKIESSAITDQLPLYICNVKGETKYVLPLYGAGLWGPIWGYIAINADKSTVYGVYFAHASETPGLGAEITNHEKFQVPFAGKQLMDNNGTPVLGVVKYGKVQHPEYEVDGISGGTITSNGVNAMLKNGLTLYKAFLTK